MSMFMLSYFIAKQTNHTRIAGEELWLQKTTLSLKESLEVFWLNCLNHVLSSYLVIIYSSILYFKNYIIIDSNWERLENLIIDGNY